MIMITNCRINEIYTELYKTIKDSNKSKIIILNLISENAMNSAYNGIKYTINKIILELNKNNKIKIQNYIESCNNKIFYIVKEHNQYYYITYINLRIYKNEKMNQIIFDCNIYI